MKHSDTVLQLFAKAPIRGKVNTRLVADIGIEAATALQFELIHDRLKSLVEADICDIQLWCSPDCHLDFFQQCAKQYSVALYDQSGADLGERMSHAIRTGLEQYSNVVLIGTDAPALDNAAINKAIDELHQGSKIVLVPSEDGGYVLIGMSQYYHEVFLAVPWGTEKVLNKTRANAVAMGMQMKELGMCWDIDRLEDYQRYRALKN